MTRIEYMLFLLARFVTVAAKRLPVCVRGLADFPRAPELLHRSSNQRPPLGADAGPGSPGCGMRSANNQPSIAGHGIFASPRAGNCGLLDIRYTVLGRQLEGTLQRAETANGSSPLGGLPVLVQAKSQHESLDMAASLMQTPVPSFPSPCL
jgi:hypothetical protein